jgi:hypothetical protein
MFPTRAMSEDPMKNQRRPNTEGVVSESKSEVDWKDLLSLRRPTRARPTVNPRVHAIATQVTVEDLGVSIAFFGIIESTRLDSGVSRHV